jgi:2-polyprenyl-3-methyl-5-hydroxy-6-metoxy-1,4-benzoquinol methylase
MSTNQRTSGERMRFDPAAERCILCEGPIARWASKSAVGETFHYDRCEDCGFVFVNPRPSIDALEQFSKTWDVDSTDGDGSMLGQSRETRMPVPGRAHYRLIRRLLKVRPGPGRLLDVGSGFGGVIAAALQAGLKPTALETTPELRETTARLGPEVTCVGGLFEHFDSPNGSFDYIVMSHVLEHVHNPRQFIHKAEALLSPGGVLRIELPNFDGIYRRLGGVRDPFFWPPGHLNHFNRYNLPALCRRFNLRVVSVSDTYGVPRNVVSKRLARGVQFLSPLVQAGTVVAEGVAKVLTKATRSGVVLRVTAVTPQ